MELSIILWAIGLFIAGGICGMSLTCICILGGMADDRNNTDSETSDETNGARQNNSDGCDGI